MSSCVTLVLGGARSGKSRYAQRRAEAAGRVTFIATATAGDDEMHAKIARHRADRPGGWVVVEEPIALAAAIASQAGECDVMVIDCLTMYAANLLGEGGLDIPRRGRQVMRGVAGLQLALYCWFRMRWAAGSYRSTNWGGATAICWARSINAWLLWPMR